MVVWEVDIFQKLMTSPLDVLNEVVFSQIAFQEWGLVIRRET